MKAAFWSLNVGLALMVLLSLLPVGLAQTWASVEHGMWYARSADFLQGSALSVFRWLRVIGDSVFGLGALALAAFILSTVSAVKKKLPRVNVATTPARPARWVSWRTCHLLREKSAVSASAKKKLAPAKTITTTTAASGPDAMPAA